MEKALIINAISVLNNTLQTAINSKDEQLIKQTTDKLSELISQL